MVTGLLHFPQEELFSYCNRPRRTITEVLADFPSAAAGVPFSYLFDLIPPLQPRAFSIASAPEVMETRRIVPPPPPPPHFSLLLLLIFLSSSSSSSSSSSFSSSPIFPVPPPPPPPPPPFLPLLLFLFLLLLLLLRLTLIRCRS